MGGFIENAETEELAQLAKKNGVPFVYNRKWRDPKNLDIPKNIEPVIRFKSKISGNTLIKDMVQGDVNISNFIIEDFIILRKDGSPTYQLLSLIHI